METKDIVGTIIVCLIFIALSAMVHFSLKRTDRENEAAKWIWNHRRAIAKQLGAYNIRAYYSIDKCKLEMPRCDKETDWMSCYQFKQVLREMEKDRPDYVFYEYAHDIKIEKPKDIPADLPPSIGASHGKQKG